MTLTVPPPGQILRWLGGPIDVRVEIDTGLEDEPFGTWDTAEWDTDTWGMEDPAWADLTQYVFSVEINAGVSRWGQRFEASSASIILDNTTGVFTPESGTGGWVLPFQPGRRLRVVAIPDAETGTKWPLFTGQIDSTQDVYEDGAHALTTAVLCTDFMAVIGAYAPAKTTPTGIQSTSARVTAALDRIDYPTADRDIQTGVHNMTSSALDATTLEECQLAADAEGGAFYADRNGKAVFKARDWLVTDDRSVNIQGYLGYLDVPAPAGMSVWDTALWDTDIWEGFEVNAAHIIAVETSWEAARIVNDVKLARTGGPVQHVLDLTSQGAHGKRSYENTDLRNSINSEVLILANRHLAAFKDSRMRVDSVTISAVESYLSEDRQHLFYDTRFGDRLSIRIRPPWGWTFDKEVHVMGLSHQITADDWLLTFQLDDAQTYEGAI